MDTVNQVRRGRPKSPDSAKKNVIIRLKEDEKMMWERKAREAGLTLTAWLKHLASAA